MQSSTIIALVVCLAVSAAAAPTVVDLDMQRGFWDTIWMTFGLDKIVSVISDMHGTLKDQFMAIMTKLMMTGTSAWGDAKKILSTLVADVLSHAGNSDQYFAAAIAQLQGVLNQHTGLGRANERGILDTVLGVFGLTDVMSLISSLPSTLSGTFSQILQKLMFSGTQMWASASVIIKELHKQLLAHASDARPLVEAAVAQLQAMLANHMSGRSMDVQRGFFDTLKVMFGLDKVWGIITDMHNGLSAKFFDLVTKVFFSGTAMWTASKDIFKELVANLAGHAENATPILTQTVAELTALLNSHITGKREVALDMQRGFWDTVASTLGLKQIWGVVTSMHGQMKDKFMSTLKEMLFAGTSAWASAKPIFSQLVADVLDHAGNSDVYFGDAINKLQAILGHHVGSLVGGRSGERGVLDILVNAFGLGDVWNIISGLHTAASDKLGSILEQVMFSGKTVWAAALVIIKELHVQLLAHASDAKPLVAEAVKQLMAVLAQHALGGRAFDMERGFWEVTSSMFGLDKVWGIITNVHGQIKEKFMNTLSSLMFAGSSAWASAVPIFKQLVADLLSHATDASPYLDTAMAQLQAIIAGHAGSIIG